MKRIIFNTLLCAFLLAISFQLSAQSLLINKEEYFAKPGLNVMVFFDI